MGIFKDMISKYGHSKSRDIVSKAGRGASFSGGNTASGFSVEEQGLAEAQTLINKILAVVKGASGSQREALGNYDGRGVMPEMQKIGKYLRTVTKSRFRAHVSPDGIPWAKTPAYSTKFPDPGLNEVHPIRLNGNRPVYAKLTWGTMVARSQEIVDRMNRRIEAGRAMIPAIYRPNGKSIRSTRGTIWKYRRDGGGSFITKAGRLFAMLAEMRVAGGVYRISKSGLMYGLDSPASAWANIHQYGGGTYKGKTVQRREILGMNAIDVKYALDTLTNGLNQRIDRLTLSAAIAKGVAV